MRRAALACLLLAAGGAQAACPVAADGVFGDGFEAGAAPPPAAAGTCHVAPAGDDAAAGTLAAPLRTVQRCAEIALPGDTCLLRDGTYRETVRPPRSGAPGAPIVFRGFPGEVATISGADPVQGWVPEAGNVYRANVQLPVAMAADSGFFANQVFAGGAMLPQAGFPNPTLPYDPMRPVLANSGVGIDGRTMTLDAAGIGAVAGGWNGAVLWGTEWFVSRTAVVTATAPDRLTATTSDASNWNRAPFWWTLTGARGALDAPGEWYYDAGAQRLSLWMPGGGPPQGIEAKRRTLAFDLAGRSDLVLRGLRLFAATVDTDDASARIELDGIDARYVSHYLTLPDLPAAQIAPGTDGFGLIGAHIHDSGIQLRGSGHVLRNSRIAVSAGNLVLLRGQGHRVENNILEDANYRSSYAAAIQLSGSGHRILRNSFWRAGRSAINVDWKLTGLSAAGLEIAYNDIRRFGLLSTDLGALYVCCYTDLGGSTIHHNVIREGYGFSPFWGTRGFYFDIEAGFNATLHHNLVHSIDFSADNLNAAIGTPRGPLSVFNNTFVGPAEIGAGVTARNNVVRASAAIGAPVQSNNLLSGTDPRFADPAAADFTLRADSPAVDAGAAIPGITDGFVGGAPDIGAFERGAPPWRAGSDLTPAPSPR